MAAGAGTDSDLPIRALFAAAVELPPEACRELARRLTDHLVVQAQNHHYELHPLAARDARFIGALRSVAEITGTAPNTTEYEAERERRRSLGDTGLPSASSIVKHYAGWPYALAAAGLAPDVPPSAIKRRRNYRRKIIHRYSEERLVECLQACARVFQRVPMVRDYSSWREDLLAGRPGSRPAAGDIPHHRTYYERYGSWAQALDAAGLDPRLGARTETRSYSAL